MLRVIPDPLCALLTPDDSWALETFPLASRGSGVADTRPGPRIRVHHPVQVWVLLDLRRHETAPPDEIVALTLILARSVHTNPVFNVLWKCRK